MNTPYFHKLCKSISCQSLNPSEPGIHRTLIREVCIIQRGRTSSNGVANGVGPAQTGWQTGSDQLKRGGKRGRTSSNGVANGVGPDPRAKFTGHRCKTMPVISLKSPLQLIKNSHLSTGGVDQPGSEPIDTFSPHTRGTLPAGATKENFSLNSRATTGPGRIGCMTKLTLLAVQRLEGLAAAPREFSCLLLFAASGCRLAAPNYPCDNIPGLIQMAPLEEFPDLGSRSCEIEIFIAFHPPRCSSPSASGGLHFILLSSALSPHSSFASHFVARAWRTAFTIPSRLIPSEP